MVANDAGAAKLMLKWLEPLDEQLKFYLEGPALKIFERERNQIKLEESLEKCLNNSKLLISGTGWSSNVEYLARKIANKKNIYSIAVIDHWVNYKERFTRESETVLPDRLWLADREAEEIASREFPELPITVLGNKWLCDLKEIVQEKKKRQNSIRRQAGAQVLYYFSEPIRDESTGIPNGHEFNALDNWIKQLPRMIEKGLVTNNPNQLKIYIRAHPSEEKNKYKEWITRNRNKWNIEPDYNQSIEESLSMADMAFGYETQALVAALYCNIPAYTTVLKEDKRCRLPHKELNHLREFS